MKGKGKRTYLDSLQQQYHSLPPDNPFPESSELPPKKKRERRYSGSTFRNDNDSDEWVPESNGVPDSIFVYTELSGSTNTLTQDDVQRFNQELVQTMVW